VTPNFTLNYGLGWEHETNVLNYDLPKPQYLAPLYGNDLSPTKKEYKNFAPAAGFAWSIGTARPTVIRGRAGIFYDTQLGWWRLGERAVIGGSGRQFIGNAAVTNPLTGQPFSTAFLNSLAYNYGTFLAQLPALRAQQARNIPARGPRRRFCCRSRRMPLNTSNLTNFNYNLVVPATFGKANQRVGQTFGSGGPRAFQLAARVSF
jgi:hypothetical protein